MSAQDPYVNIFAKDLWDQLFQDDAVLANHVRLKSAADITFPIPAAITRTQNMAILEVLERAGRVKRVGRDHYTLPEIQRERDARAKGGINRAQGAKRDEGGRFIKESDHDLRAEPGGDQLGQVDQLTTHHNTPQSQHTTTQEAPSGRNRDDRRMADSTLSTGQERGRESARSAEAADNRKTSELGTGSAQDARRITPREAEQAREDQMARRVAEMAELDRQYRELIEIGVPADVAADLARAEPAVRIEWIETNIVAAADRPTHGEES